jgi:hypothetical protein
LRQINQDILEEGFFNGFLVMGNDQNILLIWACASALLFSDAGTSVDSNLPDRQFMMRSMAMIFLVDDSFDLFTILLLWRNYDRRKI